jgi:hypothetical protein
MNRFTLHRKKQEHGYRFKAMLELDFLADRWTGEGSTKEAALSALCQVASSWFEQRKQRSIDPLLIPGKGEIGVIWYDYAADQYVLRFYDAEGHPCSGWTLSPDLVSLRQSALRRLYQEG